MNKINELRKEMNALIIKKIREENKIITLKQKITAIEVEIDELNLKIKEIANQISE